MDEQERRMVQSSLEHLRTLLMTGQVSEAIKYLNESLTPLGEEHDDGHRTEIEKERGESGRIGVDSAEVGTLEQDQQSVGSEGGPSRGNVQDDTGEQLPTSHSKTSEEDQ